MRLGEETLTDLLILDMKRHEAAHKFWVYQTTRKQEASSGTDLLLVVRDGSTVDARLYAIQAKKLYPNGQYTALRKENSLQLDNLEKYAICNDAIPYYLFYNFCYKTVIDPGEYWHCSGNYDETQLGCTLVPSWIVRDAMGASRRRRPRSFEYLHKFRAALPWRCLFDCPHWERGLPDRWPKTGVMDSLVHAIPPYGWVTLDPVPGAWPMELAGANEVDLAPIAGRYVDDQEDRFAPEFPLPDVRPRRFITDGGEMALAAESRSPEFRPRRFIFVDKGIQ